jgi:hypothetical protein
MLQMCPIRQRDCGGEGGVKLHDHQTCATSQNGVIYIREQTGLTEALGQEARLSRDLIESPQTSHAFPKHVVVSLRTRCAN